MLTNLLHRIVSVPWVYDAVQKLAGRDHLYRWLEGYLANSSEWVVLDVGGGTGELARILSPKASYIWLDCDAQKLTGLREKIKEPRALLGDASHIALRNKSVDVAVCVAVSHHLEDAQLVDALGELSRICRLKLIFLDAIRRPAAISRLMWKYDRGSHPRSVDQLRSHIERHFVIESESRNSVLHGYWLCTATPKTAEADSSGDANLRGAAYSAGASN